MAITYGAAATNGITQSDDTVTGNSTSAAIAVGATTASFTSLGFTNTATPVVIGKIITSPAALAGSIVTATTPASSINITSITFDRPATAVVASGTQILFADTDYIIATGNGVTVTSTGTFPNQTRQIVFPSTVTNNNFTINGTFYSFPARCTYVTTSSGAQNSGQYGILVNGTWNSVNTTNNLSTGGAITTGSINHSAAVNQAATQDSATGSAFCVQGTANIVGGGFYGNQNWALSTLNGTVGAAGCTLNLTNALVRLGTATDTKQVSIYADAWKGGSTTSRFNVNMTNTNIVDTYLKFLAIRSSSTFNNVRWYKTVPQTYTLTTNNDVALALAGDTTIDVTGFTINAPTFGITGRPETYYNVHIGIGNTSSAGTTTARPAIRNAVYGYETSIAPRIGKIPDFPSMRPWVEGRKQLTLTVNKPNGTAVGLNDVNTYLEDTQQNTGQLATVAIFSTANSGYTNGTYTLTAAGQAVLNAFGGTNGALTVTVTNNIVSDIQITNAGSGYAAASGTGIQIAINSANFTPNPGGTNCTLIVFPYNRYGAFATGGTPDFTGNRIYQATTTAAGLLNTTFTNSGSSGVATSAGNPVRPSSTALTGLDVLTWIANSSYPDAAVNFGSSQALAAIDQRWSANGSTAFNISIPLRGYAYEDNSYTMTEAKGGGATTGYTDVVFMSNDDLLNATNITSSTASGFSDVTLVAPAPTRGGLLAGDSTGPLIRSTSGTLTVGTTARSLDQVYAKAKYDYVQPVLNTTAGTVARTGFGMASFLTPSGVAGSADLSIGSWNFTSGTPLTAGTFKSITTTGTSTQSYVNNAAGTTYPFGNYANIAANSISYGSTATVLQSATTTGTLGTPAQWTTNSTLGAGTGASTFTAGIPANLISGVSTITTGSVTVTGTAATDQTTIQTALQNALNAAMGNTNVTVLVNQMAGSATTLSFTLTADASTGWFRNDLTPRNITFTNLTGITAATVVNVDWSGQFASGTAAAAGIVTSLNASAAFNTSWIASSSGGTVTLTARTGGTTANTSIAINLTTGGTATTSAVTVVQGAAGANSLTATFIGNTPAVGNVVPTTALTLTSSLATYITSTSAATGLVSSVGGSSGIIVLPTTGTVINTSGTLTGNCGTTTATGNIVVTGGFKQGSYTGGSTNPLLFNLGSGTNTFTMTGANVLDSGLSVTGGSSGSITVGALADTVATRSTFANNGSLLHTVVLTGSTTAGNVNIYSGNISGGINSLAAGLTPTGFTVTLGSGYDNGAAKLTVGGQILATAYNSCSIDGVNASTNGNLAFQIDARNNASISIQRLSVAGTGFKNFLLSDTSTGTISISNTTIGNGSTLIRSGNSTGSATLSNTTIAGPVINDRSGAINITGASTLSNSYTSSTQTGVSIAGNSLVAGTFLSAITSATFGDATGGATFTATSSVYNSSKNTSYTFNNCTLNANVTLGIALAPATATTITPTLKLGNGAVLSIDPGASNNLTINCANVTFGNTAATFLNIGAGNIKLLNWPDGKAIPTGFSANISTTVTLNVTTALSSASDIKVAECYVNGVLTALGTPTPSNNNTTWTYPTFNKTLTDPVTVIFFSELNKPVSGQTTGATLSVTAAPELFVDPLPPGTQPTNYTIITSTSTVSYASNALTVQWPNATSYNPGTLSWARTTLRRIMENGNATTVAWRKQLAAGTAPMPQAIFNFTSNGTIYTTGVSPTWTPTYTVNGYKDAVNSSTTATWQLWNTLGDGNTQASWDGAVTDGNRRITYGIYASGAQTSLTSGDIANIASAVATSVTNLYQLLVTGIKKASKLIPWNGQ